jgi:hypothetical protein
MRIKTLSGLVVSSLFSAVSLAASGAPAIAVTDLAYTQTVAEYFEVGESKSNMAVTSGANHAVVTGASSGTYVAGTYSYLEQRELGSYTNDIKGALLKGTTFRLVQGKAFDKGDPQPTKAEQVLDQVKTGKMTRQVRQPEVKDIVARIRKGEFPGADYVLFGTLSNVQFTDQVSSVQATTSATVQYGIDLVADFSLIDTRTLEIKGAFSAEGTGNEVKILSNRGDIIPPNRSKVMRQTSQSLAADVYAQLTEQLQIADPAMGSRVRETAEVREAAANNKPRNQPTTQEKAVILR